MPCCGSPRTGSPWRDLPDEFGKWNSVFQRFRRWAEKGVWESLFNALVEGPDFEYLMIDSSIVRAHQHASGRKGGSDDQAIGRSRGGLSTKIHAAVDALGNPLRLILTAGQVHDIRQAEDLINGLSLEKLLADKGYDSDRFRDVIAAAGAEVVMPSIPRPLAGRIAYDENAYKERNLVERFFNKIKHFRRIATRFDKTALIVRIHAIPGRRHDLAALNVVIVTTPPSRGCGPSSEATIRGAIQARCLDFRCTPSNRRSRCSAEVVGFVPTPTRSRQAAIKFRSAM